MYSVHITVNKEFTGHEGFNGSRVKAEEKRRRVGKGKPEGENQASSPLLDLVRRRGQQVRKGGGTLTISM